MDINDLTIGQAKELAAMLGNAKCVQTQPQQERQSVIVCTDKRGVVFGECEDVTARPIILTNARMALYWSADVGGVFGLAEKGPTEDCRISAVVPAITLEGVTAIMTVDPVAIAAWINAPVQGRK